jgi:replicative DNA helicase
MTPQSPDTVELVSLVDAMKDVVRGLDARRDSSATGTALSTGFADLDRELLGLWPGELTVVASLPGAGATSLALNLAAHVGCHTEKTVLLCSLDLRADDIALRLIAAHGGIPLTHLRTGHLDEEERARVREATGHLEGARILIDDARQPSLADVRQRILTLANHSRSDLLIIDRLQDLRSPGTTSDFEVQDGIHARMLKGLARELSIPVVALSRFDDDPDWFNVSTGSPSTQHLRSPVAHAADSLIFLNRDARHASSAVDPGSAWLVLARHRRGPRSALRLGFDARYGRFWDPPP